MAASMKNPVYTANLISGGQKYRLKGITTDLITDHEEKDIAHKVTITFANVKVGKKQLHSIVKLRDKIYVYANTGGGAKEVFRGIVWERQFDRTADVKEVKLICYDKLIYLMNSKDNLFVKKGKTTKDAVTELAKKWGLKIRYSYRSISNKKIIYRSETIADILVSLLNKAKKETGVGYVIRFEKNVLVIEPTGKNKTVYKIESGDNSISVSYNETMDGMVTKVKIVKAETTKVKKKKKTTKKDTTTSKTAATSKTTTTSTSGDKTSTSTSTTTSSSNKSDYTEEETGRYITVATVKGNTKKYGTLQEILEKNKDDKMSKVKKEAQNMIKKDGSPKKSITVSAVDNPWIKKGHKVYINSGNLKNYYIVKGIEHDATNHVMTMEVRKA